MAAPPVIRQGPVGKNVAPPGAPKDWKRRHLVIVPGALRIHDQPDKPPLLVLPVKDCSNKVIDGTDFNLQYPDKLHEFKVGSPQEAQQWVAAFTAAAGQGGPPPGPGGPRGGQIQRGGGPAPGPGGPRGGQIQRGGGQVPRGGPPPGQRPQAPGAEGGEPTDGQDGGDAQLDGDGEWPSIDQLPTEEPVAADPEPPVATQPEPEPYVEDPAEIEAATPEPEPVKSVAAPAPTPAAVVVDNGASEALALEVEDLKAKLQKANQEKQALQHEVTTAKELAETYKVDLDIAKLEKEELESNQAAASSQSCGAAAALTQEIAKLKGDMNVLRTNLDIATESAKTSASQRQEEVALLMAEIDDKDRLITAKNAQIKNLENDVEQRNGKIKTLDDQVKALGQSGGAFTEQLQKQVEDLQNKLNAAKNAQLSAQQTGDTNAVRLGVLENDLLELDTKCQDLENQNREKDHKIKELQANADSYKEEAEILQEELRETNTKVMDLKAEVAKLTAAALSSDKGKDEAPTTPEKPKKSAGTSIFGSDSAPAIDHSDAQSFLEKIKEKDVQIAQVTAKLKSREVEIHALKAESNNLTSQVNTLNASFAENNKKLEDFTNQAVSLEERIAELEAICAQVPRLQSEIETKDFQISTLQEASQPPDEANRNTRFNKKNEIIEQLNQIILTKEKAIVLMEASLAQKARESLQPTVKSLNEKISALTAELDAKKAVIASNAKTIDDLKNQFASAYEDGKIVANLTDIELRFAASEAEQLKRVAEANLAKQEAINKQLNERCEKIERALTGAKKLEFIENRFTECLRMIEGQKKHNRGAYKDMCERVQKETEEKKVLQAKLLLLKTEYRKVTAPSEGPTPDQMKIEIEGLKQELEIKNQKLGSMQAEFKALSHKHALLQAEFERG